MNAAITQIHKELEEAGRVSGGHRVLVLMRITLPLVFPAIAAAWIWVAAHAVRSFSIPLMLASRDNWTISVVLWNYWDEIQNLSAASALGVLLIVAITILTFLSRRLILRAYGS
jgi:iron(III) transport system permease protein